MRKILIVGIASFTAMLAACGGSGATDPSAGADYSDDTYASLPICNEEKGGQTWYVIETSKLYVCENHEWVETIHPNPSSQSSGIFMDVRDGQKYKTTKIGDQVWMAENLKYTTGSSMCYNRDLFNCIKYGRLYIWNDAMRACPTGWHLPSKEEFEALLNNVGSSEDERSENLRAASWENGTDKFGFSALPAGAYDSEDMFHTLGNYFAFFWSSTGSGLPGGAYALYVSRDYNASVGSNGMRFGFSVRCLQD